MLMFYMTKLYFFIQFLENNCSSTVILNKLNIEYMLYYGIDMLKFTMQYGSILSFNLFCCCS